MRTATQIWVAGQLPTRNGELLAAGRLGADIDDATGAECAAQCALNGLAALRDAVGELRAVVRILRVGVYVASTAGYTAHPIVANGASEIVATAFAEHPAHTRSAVGVCALPLGAPVEIDLVAEVNAARSPVAA